MILQLEDASVFAPCALCFSYFVLSACLLIVMESIEPSGPPALHLFPVYLRLPLKLTSPLKHSH